MRIIGYIVLLIVVILGMTFATLNGELVTINYYFGKSTLALSLLLALFFASGCFVGMLSGLWLLIKSKLKCRRVKQKLLLAEKEIQNLRAIPLQDKV